MCDNSRRMTQDLPLPPNSRYEPASMEAEIYRIWEASGLMSPPEKPSGKPTFTVMIPPPNVTGILHMGHALNNTMQDIVVRHRRMAGFETLWVPGTDHAGIATQAVVERDLREKEGKSREDLGREAFLTRVWEWKEKHGDAIFEQLKRLGASCDWTRTRFTLDSEMSLAVRTAFVRLWEKGLVYRGARLVNWDCKLGTAVSDDEIEYVEQKGTLWTIRYPLADGSGSVDVATTRPETMLGDTGVAVHPEDVRYCEFVGKMLMLPLAHREIPVVADDSVEVDFGTGAVKLTPGHDPADYDRGKRHKLPIINILNSDGTLNEESGEFSGMSREVARKAVLEALEAQGCLIGEEEIVHNVAVSDRSKTAIEPLVSEQWFVRMEELAAPAMEAVRTGALVFKPARWEKVYLDWLENVQDWCISRQLWWGHRIPVWYDEEGNALASVDELEIGSVHPVTGKEIVRQDEDVLDTWASSWLWPFATLGWPSCAGDESETSDLARFYPTQFLSTGRDILYLWVARMVMAGYENLEAFEGDKRCPFATCYVHATVLDGQGRRMSKSLGNGIDPVQMIEKYGADAVRFSLMVLTREGQDVKLAENRFELGQRFCNKIWNASRFVLSHLSDADAVAEEESDSLDSRWLRSRRASLVADVSAALEEYRFHDAAQSLYRFTWDDFCDWYVETAKFRLRASEGADEASAAAIEASRIRKTLQETLSVLLRLLHPFTPFLSESLWGNLSRSEGGNLLIGSEWPRVDKKRENDSEAAFLFENLQDAVRGFRNISALLEVAPGEDTKGTVVCLESPLAEALSEQSELLAFLTGLPSVVVQEEEGPQGAATDIFHGGSVYLPLGENADLGRLRESLERKIEKVAKGIKAIEGKLSNEQFLTRAGDEIVESEKNRLSELKLEQQTLKVNQEAFLRNPGSAPAT